MLVNSLTRGSLALAAIIATAALAGCGSSSPAQPSMSGTASAAAMANPNLDLGTSLNSQPAPEISLTNQFGQPMSLSQFRGKIVMLGFEDSECTTVCPLTTQSMVLAKELLGKAGNNVQLLGVDANPDATSVADVLAYSRAHGMVNRWDFLTGSPAQLKAVWSAYHIAVQVEQGQIDHTPALFIIDSRGRLQKLYLTQMAYSSISQSAQVLATEIAGLLPGHPKLLSQESLGTVDVQTPAAAVSLPAARPSDSASGTSTVTLGPGKPRLVVFFATWLTETSDLKAELTGLNSLRRGGGEEPPAGPDRGGRDRDRAVRGRGRRLPGPGRPAQLSGRPRRDGPGGRRLRRAGPALADARLRGRQGGLDARRLAAAAGAGEGRRRARVNTMADAGRLAIEDS